MKGFPGAEGGPHYNATDIAGISRAYKSLADNFSLAFPNPGRITTREEKFSRTSFQLWWQAVQVKKLKERGQVYFPQSFLEGACDVAAVVQAVSIAERELISEARGSWYWGGKEYEEEVFERASNFLPTIRTAVSLVGYKENIDIARRELIGFSVEGLLLGGGNTGVVNEDYRLGVETVRSLWGELSTQA